MKTNPVPEGAVDRCSTVPNASESYQLPSQQSSLSGTLPSAIPNGRTAESDSHWESSLFSSSFSEIFSSKCKFFSNKLFWLCSLITIYLSILICIFLSCVFPNC